MTDIMCIAVGIAAFIGFVLGMLLCMKAIDPMKEWRDGFEAAKKIFNDSKKWFDLGWDAGINWSKKREEEFNAGYDAALKRKESTDEA